MPTAPIYNGPQIAQGQISTPNLNPNVSPEQMGGGLAQGLANVGRAGMEIYKAERDKADDIAAQDAIARAQNKQTERLYNPQTGVLFRKGADLYENARTFADDFQNDLNEIQDSLGNDRVKMRFQRVRDTLWNEYNRTLSTHVQREIVDTANTSTENFLRSTKTRALTALDNDPSLTLPQTQEGGFDFSEWDNALQLMSGSIAENARRTGRSAQDVEKAIQEHVGEFHVQTIKLLSEKGNTDAVKAYKERYADQIPYQSKAAVNDAIKRGTVIDESQSWTDRILDMVTPDVFAVTPEGKATTLQEQEAAANTLVADLLKGKGEVRDQVQRRIAAEFNQRKQAQHDFQVDTFNSYATRVQKNEKYDRLSKEENFWRMTPQQRELVERIWEEKSQGKDLGKDEAKVYRFLATAYSNDEATRDWFRSLDLTAQGLTPKEFAELKTVQIHLQQANLSEQQKLEYEGIRSIHEIADDAMTSMGWKDKDENGRKYRYQFQKRLEEEVRAVESRTKKKVVPADVQMISDELLLKAAVKGKYFGADKKFLFELTPAEATAPDTKIVSDISDEIKGRIRTQFQKTQKRLPTDEEIQRAYYNEVRIRQQTRGLKFKD
jgi:hypothetical protein